MTADTTTENACRHAEDQRYGDAHADSSVSILSDDAESAAGADTEKLEEGDSRHRKC